MTEKQMKYMIPMLGLFFLLPGRIIAGDPEPKVVNTTGGFLASGNWLIDYSVGEIAITTFIGSSGQVTQGFLQPLPKRIVTGLEIAEKHSPLAVFPNPTSNQLFFESEPEAIEKANVYSMEGRLVLSLTQPGKSIDLSGFDKGIYYIELVGKQNEIVRSTRIIKQ